MRVWSRAHNPPVEFLTVGPGYEGEKQKVSLFGLFEICLVRTT